MNTEQILDFIEMLLIYLDALLCCRRICKESTRCSALVAILIELDRNYVRKRDHVI